MYFPLIKDKCHLYNSVLQAVKFQFRNTKVDSKNICILQLRKRCQNRIDDMNRLRNEYIERVTWIASHPQFKHSYGKGRETTKTKLYNIYQLNWS